MSSKVPNEILIKIFQQLHPVDQLECTLVCHRWNQLLEDHVLYQTIYIFSAVRLKKLLQKIQQRPDIANKIERLALWSKKENEAYSSSKLLSLIPNLKVLYHGMPTKLKNGTQYPWCNQIEYISENTEDDRPDSFLSCDVYSNLKTFSYNDWYINSYPPPIETAPALTNLILITSNGVAMNFDDLECIHKNSPHLKSITLSTLHYSGGAVFSGKEITPTISVTEFSTHVGRNDFEEHLDGSRPELYAELLIYISRKYPNLSTLKYTIQSFLYLKEYKVVQTGWNTLLQRLGPQLKKISFYFPGEGEQYIEALDRYDCQINYLDLHCGRHMGIAKMVLTNQAFYIQTLVLCINSPSLDWLKSFRVLKKLKLTYPNYHSRSNLQLSDILDNSPPTLESLFLCADCLDINPSYTGTSNIKTLTFESMKFDDKVDGFISQCFPHLSVLELRQCKLQNNTLNLEKIDLDNFYYYIYDGTPIYPHHWDYVIMITTLKDNKRRSYVLHENQYGLEEAFYPQNYRPFKSYPASDIDDPKPVLNFICNSVRNVGFTT